MWLYLLTIVVITIAFTNGYFSSCWILLCGFFICPSRSILCFCFMPENQTPINYIAKLLFQLVSCWVWQINDIGDQRVERDQVLVFMLFPLLWDTKYVWIISKLATPCKYCLICPRGSQRSDPEDEQSCSISILPQCIDLMSASFSCSCLQF